MSAAVEIPAHVGAGNLVYRSERVPRFVRAEGCTLWDASGRPYLDAEAANGSVPFGYRSDLFEDALKHCAALPALPSFCESDLRVDVLARLERLFSERTGVPGRVELDLGGAQGIETALRVAFSAVGQGTIVVFEGAFHGRSGVTSMLSSSPRYRELLASWGLEVARLPTPDCARCGHAVPGQSACSSGCRAAVSRWGSELSGIGGSSHRRRVSAFIFESIQNVGGMVEPDAELLRSAVAHARANGAVVIADEIFTGMHRTGPRWGFERAGITPDIVVCSKALTNGGAALSAIWCREPLAAPTSYLPGSHSATFVGIPHALGMTAAVLDRWDAWPTAEADVAALEQRLRDRLDALTAAHPDVVVETAVFGAAARIVLRGPHAPRVRTLCMDCVPDAGLIVASTGMAPDVINIHPPLVIGDADLDLMAHVLDIALARLSAELSG